MTSQTSKAQGNERLLRLADLLEADAANPKGVKFDLGSWAERPRAVLFPRQIKKLDCNTQACAVGLACLSGAFTADGLSWKPMAGENNIEPMFAGLEGYVAVMEFFDLDRGEAFHLFDMSHYTRDRLPSIGAEAERAVAVRIRELVAQRA